MTRKTSRFSKERMIYWPDEFADVVDFLNGRDENGRVVANPLYSLNTGAIVLAASIGVKNNRRREVGQKRKEISTATFAGNDLEPYIFLIPLLGNPEAGTDLIRPDQEEQVVREFERWAAGGLELLAGEINESAGKDADIIVQRLMLGPRGEPEEVGELPDLL
jgi:hypothetical protein